MTDTPDFEKEPAEETSPADDPTDGLRRALQAEREARRKAERETREALERLHTLEREQARARIVAEFDLTEEAAEFLRGDTEDELRDSARRLVETFRTAGPETKIVRQPIPALKGGTDPTAEGAPDLDAIAARIVAGE